MSDTSTFLHVDMDAFFASVEQHDRPELRGRPVVVGGRPNERGVVSAASYEARRFGIHSAMPMREAARRCPQAAFVPVNGKRYSEVSRQVFHIFERFTPLVEPLSIDEAFLDVTGSLRIFGPGPVIGTEIKKAIAEETGLSASVGVAHNKFLAKLASDMDKPDGLTVVPGTRQGVIAFLAPLPVGRIWGVGKVMRHNLEAAGITTVRQLQEMPVERLSRAIGRHAADHLHRLALGEDAREIELGRIEKSISREHTFLTDCKSVPELEQVLRDLVDDVGGRLRKKGRYAGLVRLKLRWQGFETITRQRSLACPCCDDFSLREHALTLFRAESVVKPVRLIGFGVGRLVDQPVQQLDLFSQGQCDARRERLSRSVDDIRDHFGKDSIGRAGSTQA